MKNYFLLLLLLISSYQLTAQWSQVGANLGSASIRSGISLGFNPSTNEPYAACPDESTSAFKVYKFDGTSWSQVGANLGSTSHVSYVSLVFNPSTNEPYVAYSDGASNAFKVYKFDGTSWSQVGANLGFASVEFGISLVFNPSTNEPHIAYRDDLVRAFSVQKFSLVLNISDLYNSDLISQVFPNPTNSQLNIKLRDSHSTITVKTLNSIGNLISTQHFKNTDTIAININGSSGLYFIEISTDVEFKKII